MVSLETLCVSLPVMSAQFLTVVIPFRILSSFFVMQFFWFNKDRAELYGQVVLLLSLPYFLLFALSSYGLFVPGPSSLLHLSMYRLSYYSGMFFMPIFIVFTYRYFETSSLGFCLEALSFLCLFVVVVSQLFFYDALVLFWQGVVAQYFQTVAQVSDLKLAAETIVQAAAQSAHLMPSRVIVSWFLSPLLVSILLALSQHRMQNKQCYRFKEWLSMSMSWSAFWVSVALFFLTYAMTILVEMLGFDLGFGIGNFVNSCLELARFVPSVYGLSYIHYRIFNRTASSERVSFIWFYVSTMIFWLFGGLFYSLLAFLGLADKAMDMRHFDESQESSVKRGTT